MNGFALLIALGAAAALFGVLRRIRFMEQELARVESLVVRLEQRLRQADAPPAIMHHPERAVQPAPVPPSLEPDASVSEPLLSAAPAPKRPPERTRVSLESLIGGRLPIWIGGAALVLAGFFLVRYSIESGLLGPATRTLLAALFGLALIAASELARRLPATAEDPRVGQALAGAGIASLYGTLYMAAALYHLLGPLTGFALVLVVTGAALVLSLRHGPPTAVMALVGGFAAPLVAGFDAVGIAPLLAYLGVFVAALFALAIHRGWGWLALAASATAFAWTGFLVAILGPAGRDLSAVGGFAMLLAAGASAALPATGLKDPALRVAPMIAGLVLLVALAPALEFDALAWSYYLLLAGAALFLAWRDKLYLPAAFAALGLLLTLELMALLQTERAVTPIASIAATLLFALPGHILTARRAGWPLLALGGAAGPLLVAYAAAPSLLSPLVWGLLCLASAVACGHIAWRMRAETQGPELTAATFLAALLATIGLARFLPESWIAVPFTLAILGLAAWARATRARPLYALPAIPFMAAIVAAALPIAALIELIFASATGDRLPYLRLPMLEVLLRTLALPTLALVGILYDPLQLGRTRRLVGAAGITVAILLLYAIAKQPLAIATLPRFASWGFIERALLTHACLAAGWCLLRAGRFRSLAGALFTLGLCRLVWFDLLILDPVLYPQAVGPFPIANAAVLHLALAASWLWTLGTRMPLRASAALLSLVTALAAVRQAVHGSILTGPVGTLENTGYSAALLGVALFWLWRGITAGAHDLRVFGLALLTLVTFKVFLIDAAALNGVLRILSFLGLGVALIGIGWAYNRFLGRLAKAEPTTD